MLNEKVWQNGSSYINGLHATVNDLPFVPQQSSVSENYSYLYLKVFLEFDGRPVYYSGVSLCYHTR